VCLVPVSAYTVPGAFGQQGLVGVRIFCGLGGSTEEAQRAIGVEVANAIIKYGVRRIGAMVGQLIIVLTVYPFGMRTRGLLIRYINVGSTVGSVNFPEVDLRTPDPKARTVRILNIHENVPGVLKVHS